jgi:uncharacterized protein (TIGR04255 family)
MGGRIAGHYPDAQPIADWNLSVPVQHGTPDFAHVVPELKLRYRFWGAGEHDERVWCMQCFRSAVFFNVRREKDRPHRYTELKERAMSLLPDWCEHFEVRRFKGAEVRYVNRLNAELTPQFMGMDGKLMIGTAFKLFTNIPIADCTIVPPYDCTVTLQRAESPKSKLTVRVIGEREGVQAGVAIHLGCNVLPDERDFDCGTAANALDVAHERVGEAFRRLFTDEALRTFGLVVP